MEMIKCKECGHQMSKKAKICPNCGVENDIIFCPECNKELSSKATMCPSCGYELKGSKNIQKNSKDTLSLVGMILGFCSVIAWIIPLLGFPCTIVGIILSSCSMNSNKKGFAITGLILCIVFLVVTLINSIIGAAIGAEIYS